MTENQLINVSSEDFEDLIGKIETSFDIIFIDNELIHITTFGQLCDRIADKIQLENSDDCTSQQAFYKLRNSISSTLQIDNKSISPKLLLKDIFPRQRRRYRIKVVEKKLGFKLNILRPPHFVTWSLLAILLVSLFLLYFNWQAGFLGLVFSIGGLWIAQKLANELDLKTVGQVADKMTRENYLKSRRNPRTFNKIEIEKVLTDWFSSDLYLDKCELTRSAKFI